MGGVKGVVIDNYNPVWVICNKICKLRMQIISMVMEKMLAI